MDTGNGNKIYSTQKLLEIGYGDQDFVLNMLQMFVDQIQPSLDEIEEARLLKDIGKIKAVVHKMKPSILIMEIGPAVPYINRIEELAHAGIYNDDFESSIHAMNAVLHQVVRDIRNDTPSLK